MAALQSDTSKETDRSEPPLPPVLPPTPGFLLQLFLIPGLIVVAIVLVWTLFYALAHMGSDAESHIAELERDGPSRWHAAYNLSYALRGGSNEALREDSNAAARLAAVLDRELSAQPASGGVASEGLNSVEQALAQGRLRLYLASALGYFLVPQPLPALNRAANFNRAPSDVDVQTAAVESIARLYASLSPQQRATVDAASLQKTLLETSRSSENSLREAAAFGLGMFDVPSSKDRLQALLDDPQPSVRYNAATGLAQFNDWGAAPVVLEMLDPAQASTTQESSPVLEEMARVRIVVNGIRAADRLSAGRSPGEMAPFRAALQKLSTDPSAEIRDHAKGVLDKLKNLPAS